VVVEAFELEDEGAQPLGWYGHDDAECIFHGKAVGQGVRGGGITADAFGEVDRARRVEPFEELLDAAVSEPESGFELEDAFPDDGEAEVSGFDDAGVDRPYRDFIDSVAFHLEKWKGLGFGEGRRRPGVAAHRVPPSGPMCVPHQSAGQRVTDGDYPEQVVHLAFEARGWEGQGSQRRYPRVVGREGDLQLDASVRGTGEKQVHHAQRGAIVMRCDQTKAEALLEQRRGVFGELGR